MLTGIIIGVRFWLLLSLKWLQLNVLDFVLDLIIGATTRQGSRSERKSSLKYEHSAQRVRIWTRGAYSPASIHSPANFLYTHLNYCHPNEVLKSDSITLQGVNANYAWFCVTDESINVYDLNVFPFVWVAQYLFAKELILVPVWAFEKLANEELTDPGADGRQVFMLFNTARCGSTLLCQMFGRLPNTRSMSEPWATVVAHTNYVQGKISHQGDAYEKIIQACIRLQCKPEIKRKIDRIFFKQAPWGSAEIAIVKKMCPNIKLIFNTRHPKPSCLSFYGMATSPVFVSSLQFEVERMMHRLPPLPYDDPYGHLRDFRDGVLEKTDIKSLDMFTAIVFASSLMCYARNRSLFSHVVIYEDLLENPQEETGKLFAKLSLSHRHIANVLTAFKHDSQKNFFKKQPIAQGPIFTTQQWKRVENVFKQLKVPVSYSMTLNEFRALMQNF